MLLIKNIILGAHGLRVSIPPGSAIRGLWVLFEVIHVPGEIEPLATAQAHVIMDATIHLVRMVLAREPGS